MILGLHSTCASLYRTILFEISTPVIHTIAIPAIIVTEPALIDVTPISCPTKGKDKAKARKINAPAAHRSITRLENTPIEKIEWYAERETKASKLFLPSNKRQIPACSLLPKPWSSSATILTTQTWPKNSTISYETRAVAC